MTDHLAYNPGPTVGARILETERSGVRVEVWDVSGDQSYENTWPAIKKDADGVLILYNAETPGSAKEAELWAEWFVLRPGLPPSSCACLGVLSAPGAPSGGPPPVLDGIAPDLVTLEAPEALRKCFDRLVSRVLKKRG
jgi:hypothetical protein